MLAEFGSKLRKGEGVIGLGSGKFLHIHPDGKTTSEGIKSFPPEAYFMLPLVTEVVPQEFQGPGDFDQIRQLEDTLGSFTGSVEDIYKKVGPFLAARGIPASEVAEVLMEMSPIHDMKDKDISKNTYKGYELRLTNIIKRYYPGSTISERRRQNPSSRKSSIQGGHGNGDGVDF